jgi:protein-S-isoprenylcysteine O-methyltransferase Ste14
MNLRALIGSGDKVMLFTLPFLVVAVVLDRTFPAAFDIGGPPAWLSVLSIIVLVVGIGVWLWSVILVLRKVPRGELITDGPYAYMKHPIYTSVALLVLPWAGLLLDTWAWALVGLGLYLGSRRYAPEEEAALAGRFGAAWDAYDATVKLPWL